MAVMRLPRKGASHWPIRGARKPRPRTSCPYGVSAFSTPKSTLTNFITISAIYEYKRAEAAPFFNNDLWALITYTRCNMRAECHIQLEFQAQNDSALGK